MTPLTKILRTFLVNSDIYSTDDSKVTEHSRESQRALHTEMSSRTNT